MRVDDPHVAYLRSQIAGDQQAVLGVMNELGARQMGPLVPFLREAFVLAVRRWFGPTFTHGQVIQLVARIRALGADEPDFVNPVAAESEICRALGEDVPQHPDPIARMGAQYVVLDFLVRLLDLDEYAIDALLAEARYTADQTLAGLLFER